MKEELVAGDLLNELAWVGSVELDPQVEGDGTDPLDLLRHSLRRVQPMLQNIQRSDAGCGSFCDKDEGSDWKGRRADAIPSLCVRPWCWHQVIMCVRASTYGDVCCRFPS